MSGWGAGANPPGGPIDPPQPPVRVEPFSEPVRVSPPLPQRCSLADPATFWDDSPAVGATSLVASEVNTLRAENAELRRELETLTLERDNALLEVDRLTDRVHGLEEWAREPLVVRESGVHSVR